MLLAANSGQAADIRFSMTVDFGKDQGNSPGTLFEARDPSGRIVAGAGFQDVYNTRFRNDRHTLQIFVKSADDKWQPQIERLPHPGLGAGVYMFDLNGKLYAWSSAHKSQCRSWNESTGAWHDAAVPGASTLRSGDGVTRIGGGLLTFAHDSAWYDGRKILQPPAAGGYHNFYYARGHLFFYHRTPGDDGTTRLYACPWHPSTGAVIAVDNAVQFETPYPRETPFTWGQWQNQVITISNMGGIYVFDARKWHMILQPDHLTSYQVYSAIHWHNRLLLAQYPTGNVFGYQGDAATRIQGWPPVLTGVASSARECQTLSIYNGDLLAGVWPWAELWRRNRHTGTWNSHGRMFTHPATTKNFQHPYETEARTTDVVANYWGQRITSMIPLGDSLYLSTSAKGTVPLEGSNSFLSPEQQREYGAVVRMTVPGSMAIQLKWQDRPTTLDITVGQQAIVISQDGKQLASSKIPRGFIHQLNADTATRWGDGTFGPAGCRITKFSISHH